MSDAARTRTRWAPIAALLLAGLTVVTGCSAPESTSSAADPAVQGRWHLDHGHDAQGPFDLTESWITLDIARTTNGTGLTPCNNYGVSVFGGSGAVFVTQTFLTRSLCVDDALGQLEGRYLDALVSANHATIVDELLVLTAPDAELTFRRASQLKAPEILNTLWSLDSLVVWRAGQRVLYDAGGEGTLLVAPNGGFQGGTGCRAFDGRYEVRDGELRVTRITTGSDECTPGFEAQETYVSLVLGEGLRAEVVGDLLTLQNDEHGLGLVYRAIR